MKLTEQRNHIMEREKRLRQLKNMSSEEIDQLILTLKEEHQQLVYAEAQEHEPKAQRDWRKLAVLNENQLAAVNQYLSVQYQRLAKSSSPEVPVAANAFRAFLVGGLICTFGQLIINYLVAYQGLDFKLASGLASVTIVIIAGFLTGLGVYDEIGRFGGAGSMVPISGFANSIVSAALEFKREGMVCLLYTSHSCDIP